MAEVHGALRSLTTAENLVGFDEAVKTLAQKVDLILAREDPAMLNQLETAIGALRGIVSHVASNDALTRVAEDVRALSAKVDDLANHAASEIALSALETRIETLASALTASTEAGHAVSAKVDGLAKNTASGEGLSALETRIDTLATALTVSAEAGHAVPRELEKLLAGLIEKLEWVQLTHTDHAALAHLEDRIAMLIKRFDASDARLGHLEAIERGLADLLVHIEQMRGITGKGEGGDNQALMAQDPVAVEAMSRDVAEIKQTERRTLDSLEAVQDAVEHVVNRLATIESAIRSDAAPHLAPTEPAPEQVQRSLSALFAPAHESSSPPVSAIAPAAPAAVEAAPLRNAAARPPIDPNLPPDHPLEPGSMGGRSETAFSSAKPPVIPDPGGKPDFIAAARRAAQAAAAAPSAYHSSAGTPPPGGFR